MPRVSDIEILNKVDQQVLTIKKKLPAAELPKFIGEGFGKFQQYLEKQGDYLADMPYVAYYNMDPEALEVELGFPVAKEYAGEGEIRPGVLPGGKMVMAIYRGPYGEIEPTYLEMMDFIQKNGLKDKGISYEYYLNGPTVAEEEYLTTIMMPIA